MDSKTTKDTSLANLSKANPFYFYTSSNLVELTGEKADTLEGLLELLRNCRGSAIFYHVFQSYRERPFAIRRYHSEFAQWISTSLDEEALAEKLAMLDVRDFTSIRALRESMVQTVQGHLDVHPESRNRTGKTPFFLCQSLSVAMQTGDVAWNSEDFSRIIRTIGIRSIHYHLIEARLRLGIYTNDFSYWFRTSLRRERVARRIEDIDIYLYNFEQIRGMILRFVQEEQER
jgi:hypothetical protein